CMRNLVSCCRNRCRKPCSWSAAATRSRRPSIWPARPPAGWMCWASTPVCTARLLTSRARCHSPGAGASTRSWRPRHPPSILAPLCYGRRWALKPPSGKLQRQKPSCGRPAPTSPPNPAAFIGEPVLSAGGVIVPPPGYYKALRAELERRGMLMIFDESQTGLGKTGKLFGFQHEDAMPDIITISKHFGGGLPISAVCTTAEIAERAVENGYFATRSHATDPLLCAAGEESLDIVVEEDMAGKAARIETRIKRALAEMATEFELIGDIRGRGVLL